MANQHVQNREGQRAGEGQLGTSLRICAVHELPPGARRVIEINDYEEVLVLNIEGTIHAISNICPHQGAALERGSIDGKILYCPLHRWGFTLTTGTYIDDATICLRTYTVQTKHGELFLHLP
jgi:nitrite reductase (NADH) small subunit